MTRGLIVGKFLPFHRGHRDLLERAARGSDELYVIVCDADWHMIPAELRAQWIREAASSLEIPVHVLTVDGDDYCVADDDSEGWAAITLELLGMPPDVVFTGEDYGDRYARALGCRHERGARLADGTSGTMIRASPLSHLDKLDPHVRAYFVKRVCIIGAESTGKSTLAMDLAQNYGTVAVPEFGRHFTEAMPQPPNYSWSSRDFHLIAEMQARIEDDAARWVGPLLICDTNPLVTAVLHETYLGVSEPGLLDAALARPYSLYLLCDVETPFVQDDTGLRHNGEARRHLDERYRSILRDQRLPWTRVTGDRRERVRQASEAIEPLLTLRLE